VKARCGSQMRTTSHGGVDQELRVDDKHQAMRRASRWCDRHLPSLSRRFRKFGRDTLLGPFFTLSAIMTVGRWLSWRRGEGALIAAVGWTALAATAVILGKKPWLILGCPFAYIAGQSYIHVLLGGGEKFLLVGTAAAAVAFALFALAEWKDVRDTTG